MAHKEQMDFVSSVRERHPDFFYGRKVLEVGSRNINGTNRIFFSGCEYIGIDLSEGDGVDIVMQAHEYIRPRYFDVIVETEVAEHNRHKYVTAHVEMKNLKPGGLIIFTAAGEGREEHGTSIKKPEDSPDTLDWYENITIEMLVNMFPPAMFDEYFVRYLPESKDIQFYGIKKP